MRWRTEKEVIVGKGQFECGSKACKEKENLRSWELNFGYVEHGEKKNALVKLRTFYNQFKETTVIYSICKIALKKIIYFLFLCVKDFVQNVR